MAHNTPEAHLQQLKNDPIFQRVGGPILLSAIDAILEGLPYEKPKNWGALFLAFPRNAPWRIPTSGWHIDAYYASPLLPMRSVKTFALFGDIAPRGGGTLMVSGSHRLVYKWLQENPPSRDTPARPSSKRCVAPSRGGLWRPQADRIPARKIKVTIPCGPPAGRYRAGDR